MAGLSIEGPKTRSGTRRGSTRARRRRSMMFALQLTSLMDVLMIIVVFLLKSYGISSMGIVQSGKLELPVSRAPEIYGEGMNLIIAKDKITLDSDIVLTFEQSPGGTGAAAGEPRFILPEGAVDAHGERGVLPLYDLLKKRKDEFELLASRAPDPAAARAKWTGDILVQADKAAPYELIRRVMYTAGLAGYKQFRLTVEKQPE